MLLIFALSSLIIGLCIALLFVEDESLKIIFSVLLVVSSIIIFFVSLAGCDDIYRYNHKEVTPVTVIEDTIQYKQFNVGIDKIKYYE